jgi:hypothetical protein
MHLRLWHEEKETLSYRNSVLTISLNVRVYRVFRPKCSPSGTRLNKNIIENHVDKNEMLVTVKSHYFTKYKVRFKMGSGTRIILLSSRTWRWPQRGPNHVAQLIVI